MQLRMRRCSLHLHTWHSRLLYLPSHQAGSCWCCWSYSRNLPIPLCLSDQNLGPLCPSCSSSCPHLLLSSPSHRADSQFRNGSCALDRMTLNRETGSFPYCYSRNGHAWRSPLFCEDHHPRHLSRVCKSWESLALIRRRRSERWTELHLHTDLCVSPPGCCCERTKSCLGPDKGSDPVPVPHF